MPLNEWLVFVCLTIVFSNTISIDFNNSSPTSSSLTDGIEAIMVLEEVIMTTNTEMDPTLELENFRFDFLTHPSSLKASVFQLASTLIDAFRNSETDLYKIKTALNRLNFDIAQEAAKEIHHADSQEFLNDFSTKINKTVSNGLNATNTSFHHVFDIANELSEACVEKINYGLKVKKTLMEKLGRLNDELRKSVEVKKIKEEELFNFRKNVTLMNKNYDKIKKELMNNPEKFLDFKIQYAKAQAHLKSLEDNFNKLNGYIMNLKAEVEKITDEIINLETSIKLLDQTYKNLKPLLEKWSSFMNFFNKNINLDNIGYYAKKITEDKQYLDLTERNIKKYIANSDMYTSINQKYVKELLDELISSFKLTSEEKDGRKNLNEQKLLKIKNEISKDFNWQNIEIEDGTEKEEKEA